LAKKSFRPEVRQKILASLKVQKFLNKFPNKGTRSTYQSSLIHFFDFLKVKPDEWLIDVRRIQDVNDKIDVLDKYEEDINRYWQNIFLNNYIFGGISSLLIIDALQLSQMPISSGSSSEPQILQFILSSYCFVRTKV